MEEPFGFALGHALLDLGWPANLSVGIDGIFDIGLHAIPKYSLVRVSGPLGIFKKNVGSVKEGDAGKLVVSVFGRENGPELETLAQELGRRLGRECCCVLARE